MTLEEQTSEPQANSSIVVRDVQPGDLNFIYSTWKRGLCYDSKSVTTAAGVPVVLTSYFRHIPSQIFYPAYSKVIDRIFKRPGIIVNLAVLSDAPDVILGYAVFEHEPVVDGWVVHWAYVKEEFRKNGLTKKLIPPSVKIVTHITTLGLACLPRGAIFNPFYPSFVEPRST